MKLKDGDYYAGDTMILNHKRMAALKKCTEGPKSQATNMSRA